MGSDLNHLILLQLKHLLVEVAPSLLLHIMGELRNKIFILKGQGLQNGGSPYINNKGGNY